MSNVWCDVALDVVQHALCTGKRRLPDARELPAELRPLGASFVTLEREQRLLGCVGTLEAHQPLGVDIAEHALGSAFDDPRVPPVTRADFAEMSVKVSVLSPSELVDATSYEQLRRTVNRGLDGITVTAKGRRATLLPSVWEKVDDVDEFLDALWLKARLRPRAWSSAVHVSRYTTVEYTDPGPRTPLA